MDRWLSVLWGFVTAGGRAPTLSSFPHPGCCHHQGCPVERRPRSRQPRLALLPQAVQAHLSDLCISSWAFNSALVTWSPPCRLPHHPRMELVRWVGLLCAPAVGVHVQGGAGLAPRCPSRAGGGCWRGESSGGRGAGAQLAASTRWRRRARGLLPWPWFRNGALALYPKWTGLLG